MLHFTSGVLDNKDVRDKREFWTGGWWYFTRYEITDGIIQPASNSMLRWYDPWEQYRISEHDAGTVRPYMPLLQLAISFGAHYDDQHFPTWRFGFDHDDPDSLQIPAMLTMEQQHQLLNWCSRF